MHDMLFCNCCVQYIRCNSNIKPEYHSKTWHGTHRPAAAIGIWICSCGYAGVGDVRIHWRTALQRHTARAVPGQRAVIELAVKLRHWRWCAGALGAGVAACAENFRVWTGNITALSALQCTVITRDF